MIGRERVRQTDIQIDRQTERETDTLKEGDTESNRMCCFWRNRRGREGKRV